MDTAAPDVRIARLAQPVGALAEQVRLLEAVLRPLMGKWEADVEALNLLLLAATHALSTARLARSSPSLQPSACVLARSGMEAGAKALWLLYPDDPFEREARWLVHLESDADACQRLAKAFSGCESRKSLEQRVRQTREVAAAVGALLPGGLLPPREIPNLRAMLEAVGYPEKYLIYILLSQAAHGTHYATGAYRRNLGAFKEHGEFIRADDWSVPLSTCWWFVAMPLLKLGERYGVAHEALLSGALERAFSNAQTALTRAGASAKR